MGKKIRWLLMAVLCMIAAVGCLFAVGCSEQDVPQPSGTAYTVTVEASDHGTVTSDKTEYYSGATVTLTVKPDSGYELSSLKMNETELTVTGNKATFKMPAEDVTVSATFAEEGLRTITVVDANGVSIKADKESAKEGNTVKLTVNVTYGYELTGLKMNSTDLTVTDGKAEFTMPDANVNVTATAALASDLKQGAAPEAQLSFDATVANKTATAKLIATYGDDKFTVAAYVTDERVTPDKDSLELYFGREGYAYAKLTSINKGVKVCANGDSTQYEVASGAYTVAGDGVEGFNVKNVQPWSADGTTVDGYYIEVEIAYTVLGFEGKADAENKIAVLPVLNNYFSSIGDSVVYGDYDKLAPNTYPVIKDGEWTDNIYAEGTGMLGSYGNLKAGNHWNLENDYLPDDVENYPNRYVTLTGHDGVDNNLMFYRAAGKSVYAEATFKITELFGEDQYRKFGLMMFDNGAQQGAFYYVDAATVNKTTHNLADITGDGIGHNLSPNGAWNAWSGIKGGVFNAANEFTMKMAYDGDKGIIYFWYVNGAGEDVLATKAFYTAKGNVVMGFKSFAAGLRVTNYFATNDKTDPEFVAHMEDMAATSGMLGDSSRLFHSANWDLDFDYPEDHEKFDERKAVLGGASGDNDLFFKATEGVSSYVRATFRVDQVLNGEKWGKFGLMLFDGASQNGLFYYVDAFVGDANDGVIRGDSLGYNYAPRGWAAWSGIAATGGAFNKTTKTITLAMTYADDVISMYYKNAAGADVLATQIAHVHVTGTYVIGIKSFNYALTVTDYTVNTDTNSQDFKDHNPALTGEDIDVLFAGDSYMEFWKNYGVWDTLTYDMTSAGMKLVNVGIGGTRIHEWNNEAKLTTLKLSYSPAKIVFHIGVNDIDSGEVSVDETYNRLNGLLTEYHKAFPAATIYWVSCIPNNFYINNGGTYNSSYTQLNVKAKALMDGLDYAVYIDMETPFTTEDGDARSTYLHSTDGLHMNANYGYPLWTAVIKRALGLTLSGDDENYLMGNYGSYAATPAWSYGTNGNIAELSPEDSAYGKSVNTEESIYYKAAPAADLLFEADIRSNGKFHPDEFSKVGVMLANEYITIFAYFDAANGTPEDGAKTGYASLVVRPTFYNADGGYANRKTGIGDWVWGDQRGAEITVRNIKTTFSKIGIAKKGSTVYLLVDGISVASWTDIDLESCWNDAHNGYGSRHGATVVTAASKFTAGVMTFNRRVEIKSVNYTTDVAEITDRLLPRYTISVPAYGSNVQIAIDGNKKLAKEGESVSFTVTAEDISGVYVTYDSEDHELTLEDGKYTFAMPDCNVTLKVTFDNSRTVTLADSIQDKVAASALTVQAGQKVTFSAQDGWFIKELYAGETEIVKSNGVYEFTVDEDVTITGVVAEYVKGMILDGELTADEGWTQAILDTGAYFDANGSHLTVYAFNTTEGVRIAGVIKHFTPVTQKFQGRNDADAWHLFLNLEIRINGVDHPIQTTTWGMTETSPNVWTGKSSKYSQNISAQYWRSVVNTGADKDFYPYITTCEIVVNHSVSGTNANDPVSLAMGGVFEYGFRWLGGANENVLRYTHNITADGLTAIGNEYKALYTNLPATMDGVFDDAIWTSEVKARTYSQISRGAKVSLMGVKATNGVMLGVTVEHYVAPYTRCQAAGDKQLLWWHYMGPEFRLNNVDRQVATNTYGYSQFSYGVVKTSQNSGKWTTTFEIYVPYSQINSDGSGDIPLAFAGVYENGWELLHGSAWANPIVSPFIVTATGIKKVNNTAEGVYLDGKLDDGVWTESKLSAANTIEYTIATGNVKINAVKLTDGVLLGVRVTSSHSAFTPSHADNRFDWAHYQNLRLNLFATSHYVYAYGPSINGIANGDKDFSGTTKFGACEVDNGDGTYTATYEIYVPKVDYAGCDFDGNIAITLVVHTNQADVNAHEFLGETTVNSGNWFQVCGYITNDGCVKELAA